MRKGMGVMPNNGDVSTHLMESVEYDGKNYVYPTIYPVSPNKYVNQSFDEAWKRGEVFEKAKSTISEHIKNVFEEGELNEEVVVRDFRTTSPHGAIEGKRGEAYNGPPLSF